MPLKFQFVCVGGGYLILSTHTCVMLVMSCVHGVLSLEINCSDFKVHTHGTFERVGTWKNSVHVLHCGNLHSCLHPHRSLV